MTAKTCLLIGAPVDSGASQNGCLMGPDALRTAGLPETLRSLGYRVEDFGNVAPAHAQPARHANPNIKRLAETAAWAEALEAHACDAMRAGAMPIFMGGDHSLSLGTVPGVARHAREKSRPQFVLWLDAHTDFHTLDSSESGNLHGVPVAYFTGQPGFATFLPNLAAPVPPQNVCLFGIRSVDPAERQRLRNAGITVVDMRTIDEEGVGFLLRSFLNAVAEENGALHVSLDVDFLEPSIAPGVGTTVPGGATFREAHLVMEMLHGSGLVTSLDLVELNPFLDERGRSARLLVDLTASLMGRTILDRETQSF